MAKKTLPAKTRVKAGVSKMTAKDRIVVYAESYLSNGGNKLQAAIAAGFSEKTAGSAGYRMFKNVEVQQIINNRRVEVRNSLEITTERILKERARLAFFDPRKLFDATGRPIPIHELDDDTAAALAGLDVLEEFEGTGKDRKFIGLTKKYKLADKGASLTALEKHLGMYEKHNLQKTGSLDGLPVELLRLMVARLRELIGNGQRIINR